MKHFQIKRSITDRSTDSVRMYLKDISKYPLLTPEQEKELAIKAANGDKQAKKDFDSLNFRPSATSLKITKAIEAMNEEKIEQSTMINCLKNVKTTQLDRMYSPKIIPAEITKDTKWYEGRQQPKTIFYKVKSYIGRKIIPVGMGK